MSVLPDADQQQTGLYPAKSSERAVSATLEEILAQALQELAAANDLQALDQIHVQYLGKKGAFTLQMKELGKLDPDQHLFRSKKRALQPFFNPFT
jgi:phenylalanyl-tRNA synthetase alpha subunit